MLSVKKFHGFVIRQSAHNKVITMYRNQKKNIFIEHKYLAHYSSHKILTVGYRRHDAVQWQKYELQNINLITCEFKPVTY